MGLRRLGDVALPEHRGAGGFDHAAVDRPRGLLHVAHTANDAVDVIDLASGRLAGSIAGMPGVAGVLVDEASGTVFATSRAEDMVAIFASAPAAEVEKVAVGRRPNGLALDPGRGLLLVAGVGDERAGPGVTLVDVARGAAVAVLALPGRTRWAAFDPERNAFLVNVAAPACIAVVSARGGLEALLPVPERGPHGLEIDRERGRLYCACDSGVLLALDARTGAVVDALPLSGAPDVEFLDPTRARLYVAVADPGVMDVVDVAAWRRVETVTTGPGAHTLALDADAHRVFAFLPGAHAAAVFSDEG